MHQIVTTKTAALKKHVRRYRGRYSALATLTVCVAVNSVRVTQVNEFLEEHNLLEQFYNPEATSDNS